MQKLIAAGGLIINEKQEILLMYRRQHWDLPKGKLDDGETIEQCAVREVKEEVGLDEVKIISFICTTQHIYFDKWINKDVIKETWWYLMQAASAKKLIPQTEEDIEQIIWVNKNEIQTYLQQSYPSINEVYNKYMGY